VLNATITSGLCGGRVFLDGLQAFLETQGIAPKRMEARGPLYVVTWARRDSLRLEEIMYAEPGPFMLRKRVIFSDYRREYEHLAA